VSRLARFFVAAFALCYGIGASAHDATLARRLADGFIVPRYEALARAADAQRDAWRTFCAAPTEAALADLRAAYLAAADAWSSIEIVRYGPVSEDFRLERISYWPERKNATGRGLAQLLADAQAPSPTPEGIRRASAAVQGLPALERLLYAGPPPQVDDFSASREGERRCAVGRAIAANVANLAAEIIEGWTRGPTGLAARLSEPETAKVAVRRLATDLLTSFQVMRDVKVLPVLGPDAAETKPRLAEGWRSGRPTRALALNLEAAETMARIMLDDRSGEQANSTLVIRQAKRIAEGLPSDFAMLAGDVRQRHRVILLFDALGFARDSLLGELPAALGISLGFNGLDGD
jgi:predicted lipoprotein